jgi:hypothetical protein
VAGWSYRKHRKWLVKNLSLTVISGIIIPFYI